MVFNTYKYQGDALMLERLRVTPLITFFFQTKSYVTYFLTIFNPFLIIFDEIFIVLIFVTWRSFSWNERHRKAVDELFHFVSFTFPFEYFNSIKFWDDPLGSNLPTRKRFVHKKYEIIQKISEDMFVSLVLYHLSILPGTFTSDSTIQQSTLHWHC